MTITFEIHANDLKKIQKITGQKKRSHAVSYALKEYLRMREKQTFLEKVLTGKTNYSLSNEELEAMDV